MPCQAFYFDSNELPVICYTNIDESLKPNIETCSSNVATITGRQKDALNCYGYFYPLLNVGEQRRLSRVQEWELFCLSHIIGENLDTSQPATLRSIEFSPTPGRSRWEFIPAGISFIKSSQDAPPPEAVTGFLEALMGPRDKFKWQNKDIDVNAYRKKIGVSGTCADKWVYPPWVFEVLNLALGKDDPRLREFNGNGKVRELGVAHVDGSVFHPFSGAPWGLSDWKARLFMAKCHYYVKHHPVPKNELHMWELLMFFGFLETSSGIKLRGDNVRDSIEIANCLMLYGVSVGSYVRSIGEATPERKDDQVPRPGALGAAETGLR